MQLLLSWHLALFCGEARHDWKKRMLIIRLRLQSYNPRLMTRIKEVMNCLNMRSMSRQRSSLRRLPRINSGLYILTNWCLSLITSKIHTKYYVGAGRFFESFMLRHFIYKQSYILHIGVVPERKWI